MLVFSSLKKRTKKSKELNEIKGRLRFFKVKL